MFPTWKNKPRTVLSRIALVMLRLAGWTPLLAVPPSLRVVAVAAPHTHDHDFWVGMGWLFATQVPLRWIGKKDIFREPFGTLLRKLGGIALDRSRKNTNLVKEMAEIIQNESEIVLAIAPEGTRAKAPYWRTGFYYMALQSNAAIGILIIDWQNKRIGITEYFYPTGDIEEDFKKIQNALHGIKGRVPEYQGPIIPNPKHNA